MALAFERYRSALARIVSNRLDRRLQGRLDIDDVLQEVYLEASARLEEHLGSPGVSFAVWLHFLTKQKVLEMHRRHLEAQVRDARREQRLDEVQLDDSSAGIANHFLSREDSATSRFARGELERRIKRALGALDPIDREILLLRYWKLLSNAEAAQELGIGPEAASKRHLRALKRLAKMVVKGKYRRDSSHERSQPAAR
jgi:RNA polymerase sigma-70 factor (ECF subfamily)